MLFGVAADGSGGSYPSLTYTGSRPHAVTSATASGGSNNTTFTYDANGNTYQELDNSLNPIYTYSYNAENMVILLSSPAGSSTYAYDANQQLVVKGNIVVYIGGIFEKNISTGAVTKYYFLNGVRVAMRQGSTVSFLTADNLGSTALLTDSSGNMVSRLRYYPYGTTRTLDGSVPATDRLFTGQQQETAQIYNYNARMYNTNVGRMPQADSVVPTAGDPQAYNRYSYVTNNPATYVDPSGHCESDGSILPASDPSAAPGRVYVSWAVGASRCGKEFSIIVTGELFQWTLGKRSWDQRQNLTFLGFPAVNVCFFTSDCYTRRRFKYILSPAFVVLTNCVILSSYPIPQCAGQLYMISGPPIQISKIGLAFGLI